jgi:hypothetical protein
MSAIGSVIQQVQEFVDPMLYSGYTNKQILDEFQIVYQDDPNFFYMNKIITEQLRGRSLLTE